MMSETYNPRSDTAAMLDRALEIVNGVPYEVSARFVFYVLLQEGWYSSKSDYKNRFMKAISRARHALYGGWRPDTLVDDTREAIVRGRGFTDVAHWLDSIPAHLPCELDRWIGQERYIELWFEARAMIRQFQYYTDHITLRPMAGQPSIDYKWQTAKALERAAQRYEAPIVILYFGDLDEGGETIEEVIERDVSGWCGVDFDFVRCGLTPEQVARYNVPENFEKPGEYQWEALSDQAAGEIIRNTVQRFMRHDALSTNGVEDRATKWLRAELAELAERLPAWADDGA